RGGPRGRGGLPRQQRRTRRGRRRRRGHRSGWAACQAPPDCLRLDPTPRIDPNWLLLVGGRHGWWRSRRPATMTSSNGKCHEGRPRWCGADPRGSNRYDGSVLVGTEVEVVQRDGLAATLSEVVVVVVAGDLVGGRAG